MMSASMAVTSGSSSARFSFAIEQHECTHRCCAFGRGVNGGPTSISFFARSGFFTGVATAVAVATSTMASAAAG